MRRYSCTVKLVLNFKDNGVEEDAVEEAITRALKRLSPSEVQVEDIAELDPDDEDGLESDFESLEEDEDDDDENG